MKKVLSTLALAGALTTGLMAADAATTASDDTSAKSSDGFISFEFDVLPYYASGDFTGSGQSFILGFKVTDDLRAGIMQERMNLKYQKGGATATGTLDIYALNLEYTAFQSIVDAKLGLDIGTANSAAVPVAGPSTSMLTDVYVKGDYVASEHAYLGLKLGYRMLPIADPAAAAAFSDMNGAFLKLGVGVKF